MATAVETLSAVEKKICVMLFLHIITPEGLHTIRMLRDLHDQHLEEVLAVENDPKLYPRVLQEFGDTAQIITVLDWDEQW